MNYKLIAFDMDGTLLNSNKKIQESSLNAIHDAFSRGKEVVLSTGRCLPELYEYFSLLPELRYVIGVSGGYVYDVQNQSMIYENLIDEEHALKLLEIAKEEDCMIHLLNTDSVVDAKDVPMMAHYHMGIYQPMYEHVTTQVNDIIRYYTNNPYPLAKINFYHASIDGKNSMLDKVRQLDLECVEAETTSVECSAKDVSKATGLIKLCEYLDIDVKNTIVVGDADNDLEILKVAGLSVAMGNANEKVKSICDVIVEDNDHGGCAEAIYNYLLK